MQRGEGGERAFNAEGTVCHSVRPPLFAVTWIVVFIETRNGGVSWVRKEPEGEVWGCGGSNCADTVRTEDGGSRLRQKSVSLYQTAGHHIRVDSSANFLTFVL